LGIGGARVALHSHICYSFATEQEFAEAIGFLEAGLRASDHCVFFGDDKYDRTVCHVLQERGLDPDDLKAQGRFTWLAGDSSFEALSKKLITTYQRSMTQGASVIRCLGVEGWRQKDWPTDCELRALEIESNRVVQDYPCVVMCLQDLRSIPGLVLRYGVLSTHPLILQDEHVGTNPLFVPEDKFLPRRKTLGEILDHTARAEAEQREYYQRFQKAFQHAAIGMALKDLEGRFIEVNEALCTITGYTEQELTQMDFKALTHPADLPRNLELFHQLMAGEIPIYVIEKRYIKKDGEIAWVRISVTLLRDELGVPTNMVHLCENITPRRQAEEALRQKEEQLRRAMKMEALGQLAGGLAHDFNNLLTVINGYSDLLLHEKDSNSVQQIRNAGERAAALTRQLLAFSRKQILQPRILDLNALIVETTSMLRPLIGENIKLVTALDAAPSRIKADPGQIQQVIMNLTINSRDAMPQGGTLAVRTLNVDGGEEHALVGLNPGNNVAVLVSDTGIGMDAETQSHIFEPFFTTKGVGQGTGLGLSMVYGIVQQSGGSIQVESEPGRGTTFKLCFPVAEESAEPAPVQPREAAANRPATILLVEDETPVREVASRMLNTAGYVVLQATGGEEALRLCEKYPGRIDLLLTDIVLPDMSGLEIFKQVSGRRPEMKVVYMSGYTGETVLRHGALEPSMIAAKPFTKDELVRKIQAALEEPTPNTSRAKL
jgi:PAS domain S-box-containing protein